MIVILYHNKAYEFSNCCKTVVKADFVPVQLVMDEHTLQSLLQMSDKSKLNWDSRSVL